jgi:geranylgeranyl diphosphate synthase, type II
MNHVFTPPVPCPFPRTSPRASPAPDPILASLRKRIDQRLAELLPKPHDAQDRVAAALHDGVLAPGKRTRPLMMLLAGRGLGAAPPALLDVACAVEMVHTASLFLDDMPCMDNAWLRRGRLSTHARYGQDVAMLGAVALLSRAWAIVASSEGLSNALRAELVVVLADAVGHDGLVRGQYRDLHEGAGLRAESDIASANRQKTGVLFAAALDMSARIAGADDSARQLLRAAADEMGHAFQLRDDLQDCDDEAHGPGKDRHKDEGKSTLVALLGRDEVSRRMQNHLAKAAGHLRGAFAHSPGTVALMLEAFGMRPDANPSNEAARLTGDEPFARAERSSPRPTRRPGNGMSARI